MRKIAGTVIATVATTGLMLYATTLISNNESQHRLLQQDNQISDEILKEFNDFASQNHRSYLTKAEYQARLQAFKVNYEEVQRHNNNSSEPFKLAINQFGDWTQDEYLHVLINMTMDVEDPKKFLVN